MEGHLKLHLQSLEILAQNPRSPQPYFALTLAPPIGPPLGPPLGYPLGSGMKGYSRMSLDPPHSIFFYPLNIQLSKNVAYILFTRIYNQLCFLPETGPS